jgi:hypothetical protein
MVRIQVKVKASTFRHSILYPTLNEYSITYMTHKNSHKYLLECTGNVQLIKNSWVSQFNYMFDKSTLK